MNFIGDDQADRTVHGGVDKAVYSYAREDYEFWREHEGLETAPGLFGENLTLEGIDLSSARVGERWRVGSALLEVTQPRLPCFKLGIRMGDNHFPKRFQRVSRMGAYLRIIEEGDVGAGDPVPLECDAGTLSMALIERRFVCTTSVSTSDIFLVQHIDTVRH